MNVQSQNGKTTAEVCESCMPMLIALQNRNIGLEETIRLTTISLFIALGVFLGLLGCWLAGR